MGKCATVSGVAAVAVAAVIGQWASRTVDPWYRAVTSARALKAVLSLSRAEVNDFTASYELFEHDVVNNPALESKIKSYYRVVNHLCALGEVEKMYIPPVYDLAAGVYGNQLLFEKDMAATMDAGAGERLLELGCGRGRIAHHMARLTGAKVTGLNIGEDQVANAREYASATGMEGQLDFVLGSYNDPLPFPNNTFDGFYHVQALTYARDLDALFAELARVLKPGAKVSFLDWFQLDAYDARNKTHASLLRKTKAIIGAVYTPTAQEYIAALRRAGFQIEFSKEASKVGHQFPLIQQARDFFMPVGTVVNALVSWGLLDEATSTLLNRLNLFVDDFIESDRLGLFTTSWWIVAQKPPTGARRHAPKTVPLAPVDAADELAKTASLVDGATP